MKKKIQQHKIESHTDDWYAFRDNGVGSSEVGCMMGLSPYKLALSLFEEKIGLKPQWTEGNVATYWGTHMEDLIAKTWEKTDPLVEDSYVENDYEGVILRKCHKVKGYLTNPDYPYLFSSPDRIINKGQLRVDTGELNDEEGILEIKTANIFAMKKWEAEVPPAYIMQVQQQLLVTELEYAEIAIFDNLRNLKIYPIVKDDKACDYMLAELEEFWQRVEQGRNLMVEYNHYKAAQDHDKMNEIFNEISNIAPTPAEGQEFLYKEYLNEQYKAEPIQVTGTDTLHNDIVQIKQLDDIMKKAKERSEALKNNLREYMANADTMEWEAYEGRVTWKAGKNGSRSLRISGIKSNDSVTDKVLGGLYENA